MLPFACTYIGVLHSMEGLGSTCGTWLLHSLVPRPLPVFQCTVLKTWEWPGDEANCCTILTIPSLLNDLQDLHVPWMAHRTRSCKPNLRYQNIPLWDGGGQKGWGEVSAAVHPHFCMECNILCTLPTFNFNYCTAASRRPTYGELIDLLEKSEKEAPLDYEALCSVFQQQYPHIRIARPKRFYDTVNRIAAPTKPSSKGDSKLCGSPLVTYRKREWLPRVRYPAGMVYMKCIDLIYIVHIQVLMM